MNIYIVILQCLTTLAYLIYYFKSGITNKGTYIFLGIHTVISLFASKIVFIALLTEMICLYIRDFGSNVSRAVPIVIYLVFAILGFFINYVLTKEANWNYVINLIYLIPGYIIYLLEMNFIVYKEDTNES